MVFVLEQVVSVFFLLLIIFISNIYQFLLQLNVELFQDSATSPH